jgi:hypothetical protein
MACFVYPRFFDQIEVLDECRCCRSPPGDGEPTRIMGSSATDVEQLERVLLRRGVGARDAERDRCADCGRTPLTGEHVHLYGGGAHSLVCELCRPARRETPAASEVVRHCEHGYKVRFTRAA